MKENFYPNDAVDDFEFAWWKETNEADVRSVDRYMVERVSRDASPAMVGYVTLVRYSALIQMGRESLRGRFTAEELQLLFNAHPQPWWHHIPTNGHAILADAIYWEYVHERAESPLVSELMRKLLELDVFQQMVLTDVLECGWRSKSGAIAYAIEALECDKPVV